MLAFYCDRKWFNSNERRLFLILDPRRIRPQPRVGKHLPAMPGRGCCVYKCEPNNVARFFFFENFPEEWVQMPRLCAVVETGMRKLDGERDIGVPGRKTLASGQRLDARTCLNASRRTTELAKDDLMGGVTLCCT